MTRSVYLLIQLVLVISRGSIFSEYSSIRYTVCVIHLDNEPDFYNLKDFRPQGSLASTLVQRISPLE